MSLEMGHVFHHCPYITGSNNVFLDVLVTRKYILFENQFESEPSWILFNVEMVIFRPIIG